MEEMGITGSMLVGLHSPSSDIDFVVYGPWWWKARDIVARAKAGGKNPGSGRGHLEEDLLQAKAGDQASMSSCFMRRERETGA